MCTHRTEPTLLLSPVEQQSSFSLSLLLLLSLLPLLVLPLPLLTVTAKFQLSYCHVFLMLLPLLPEPIIINTVINNGMKYTFK